ncbi:phospholipase D-like domain-containing protein [Erythrobacter sp. EC-HK427]|uniref:phospholipase D-like domain-containing protein n=1 Tax=Erythrobacter sp. EC-HK427 TaxID=2038396 RepID=UPI0012518E6D|nr:phospholipase D-like domain-containing protein [Erythrobacter sp. EC-HK427]VVT17445.1 Phospholipase D [Erythrobacter sp. EC-HK427]
MPDIDDGLDDNSVEPGVWRYARARRVRVVVDGEDYFDLIQQAMLNAQQRILLIGWDFDTRIHLSRGRRWWQKGWRRNYPSRLGSFIVWLSRNRPNLEIRILKWSYGVFQFFSRGAMMLDLLRWWPHRRIDFKFDTAHPVACSHHQKIVVIDCDFAVCGGIDLTTGRWDTREHRPKDSRRRGPSKRPYGPWHDVAMFVEGDAAAALDGLGRSRWIQAGGKALPVLGSNVQSAWPEGLSADFEDIEVGISRTRAAYGEVPKIDEVEQLFLDQIAAAKLFVYVENQFLTSRTICEAIAKRLAEDNPPEFVFVMPLEAESWLENSAMSPARARLYEALQELDCLDRFHLFVPYNEDTPIYVHAKLMIVDDRILRIGSANMNNRSMGLDSECDVFIDCARKGNAKAEEGIRALRYALLAEHLGVREENMPEIAARHDSMASLIAAAGDSTHRHLRPFHPTVDESLLSALADRQLFDPEEPEHLFTVREPRHGLFRPGSVLAKARNALSRKRRFS